MKKLISSILIALMCKFLIGQRLVGNYYDYGKIHPHEQYYVNSAGQKTGIYKEYNQDGVVIKECNYLNGMENGTCSEYVALPGNQRALSKKATFKNGLLDGPFAWYCQYTDFKTKVSEGVFKNDKRIGVWKYWNCTDNPAAGRGLTSVGSFTDGLKDGLWTYYQDNGKVASIGKFSNDKETGEWKYYTQQGTLDRKGSFIDGKPSGIWYYFEPSDSTKSVTSGNYLNGKRIGDWTTYYDKDWNETTNKSQFAYYQKVSYDNGGMPINGLITTYFITGEKQSEYHVKREGYNWDIDEEVKLQRNGLYTSYFKNGKVEMKGEYSGNGSFKDDWTEYYESGKVKSITSYTATGNKYQVKNFDEQGNEK